METKVAEWSDFPGSSDEQFDIVVCDEAHLLRTQFAKSSIAVQWLLARFHVLATESPLPGGIPDWAGYAPLIESLDAESWLSEALLKNLGVASSY